jgi:hypothetical protein
VKAAGSSEYLVTTYHNIRHHKPEKHNLNVIYFLGPHELFQLLFETLSLPDARFIFKFTYRQETAVAIFTAPLQPGRLAEIQEYAV